jgi:adenylate kinase
LRCAITAGSSSDETISVRLVFLGPPGAGKGTQARILQQYFGIPQISTGDILRENRALGTSLGTEAEGYMKRGELVPDAIIVAMIGDVLKDNSSGFVLDGFPRTVAQAVAFDDLLARKGWTLDGVVLFDGDRKSLTERLSARWVNPRNGRSYNAITSPPKVAGVDDEDGGTLIQREDDRPETIVTRLEEYDAKTRPLIDYYRGGGRLVEIDALRDVDEVAAELAGAIRVERAAP